MAEGQKVGSIFYESSIDPKGVQSGADAINKSVKGVESGLGSLTPAIKAVGIALTGVFTAVKILEFLKDVTLTAARTETLGVAMYAVAKATNTSTAELDKQEAILKKQGITTQESRSILTLFMQSQLAVADASKVARVAQDLAVIGGENSSDTARNLTEAISSQNVMMLRQYGIVTNTDDIFSAYAKTLGKTSGELTTMEKKQAFVYLILNKGQKVVGAYGMSMETVGKKITSLPRLFEEAANAIGGVFLPILGELVDLLSTVLGGIPGSDAMLAPFRALATVIYGALIAAKQLKMFLGAIFGGIYETIKYGIKNGAEVFKSGLADMVVEGAKQQEGLNKIWGKGVDKRTAVVGGGFKQEEQGSSEKSAKIMKDLEKETQKYIDENKKREASFLDSLANLIWAHQDKVASLKKDLDSENKDFSKSMADRAKDFKASMDEMKIDHAKQLTELQGDLTKETDDHAQKVTDIQALIDKELAYGKNARMSKVRAWQEEMAQEIASYDKKSAAIQTKIDEENAKYDEQVAKAVARDAEETAREQEVHNQKVADTQTQLDSENAILNAHTAEVAMIKDKERQDDITRLVSQYADENVEAAKQHSQRMVDITNSGAAEGAAGGGAFMGEVDDKMNETKGIIDLATKDMAQTMIDNISTGALEAGKQLIKNFVNGIVDNAKSALKWAAKVGVLGPGAQLFESIASFKNVEHYASGVRNFSGGMAVVGENGPELVNLPAGSDVYSNQESRGMGRTINVTIQKMETRQDMDALVRELGFRISQLPA